MIFIKFSGKISGRKKIRALEEELIDTAVISGWKYDIITENFRTLTAQSGPGFSGIDYSDDSADYDTDETRHVNSSEVYLEGIQVELEKGLDPLRFSFDKKGKLASISLYTSDTIGFHRKLTVKKYEFLYFPYIKINTGNYENHIKVVKLLDYFGKAYFSGFSVTDTSFYWENRDEEDLKVRFWKSAKNREIII